MITAAAVELRAGARLLLDAATFRVAPGDRVGLVGRNGAGKTTLTKALAGEAQPAAGTITRSGEVGYLPQDPRTGDLRHHRPRPGALRPRAGHASCATCAPPSSAMASADRRDAGQGDAPLRPARGRVHRRAAGTPPRPRPRTIAGAPRARRPGARPAARHPLRRPAPPHRAGPHPVLRRRDPAPRRADQPPRRRLDRLAARLPQGLPRRPRRDLATTSSCSTPWSTRCSTSTPTAASSTSTTWAGRPTCSSARPTSGAASASGPTPRRRPRR